MALLAGLAVLLAGLTAALTTLLATALAGLFSLATTLGTGTALARRILFRFALLVVVSTTRVTRTTAFLCHDGLLVWVVPFNKPI
jgi:hypothetical protein